MALRIYLRHTQNIAFEPQPGLGIMQFDPIIYVGANPASLTPVIGTVPSPIYKDYTEWAENLNDIVLSITTDVGGAVGEATSTKRSASSDLMLTGDAYSFVKGWLRDHVSFLVNTVDVRIEDEGCGIYEEWVIKPYQITWCDDDGCYMSVTLQQKDPALQCIQKTMITDNHKGWFPLNSQPANGKKHPRFVYCNEQRPNAILIMLWWISGVLLLFMYLLTPIINSIIAVIWVIKGIIDAIKWLFGGKKIPFSDPPKFFDPGDVMKTMYLETSGCGRMHVAPLIRDYIQNVCDKCGIRVDETTAPIFFAREMIINTSAEKGVPPKLRGNPYFNATYMFPQVARGIRIFRRMLVNADNPANVNTVDFWQPENAPLETLHTFLNKLNGLFNASWAVKTINGAPTLFFNRKDLFFDNTQVFDFSKGSDRNNLIQGICFTPSDKTQFAAMSGLYTQDSIDLTGNEALRYFNDHVSLGDFTNNPLYNGINDKTNVYFSATKFRCDGAETDYVFDAVQQLLLANAFLPGAMVTVANLVMKIVNKYADYALLLNNETSSAGKVIIWNEDSGFDFARAVTDRSPVPTSITGGVWPEPQINSTYNFNGEPWHNRHIIKTGVLGYPHNPTFGVYRAADVPNLLVFERVAYMSNYPMMFKAFFKDNLYDWFHWIDDVKINPNESMTWTGRIPLCCEDLKRLKVFGDGAGVVLGNKVGLLDQYFKEGIITQIDISYKTDDPDGQYIELKGTC